jgi:hypothetical protein
MVVPHRVGAGGGQSRRNRCLGVHADHGRKRNTSLQL